VRPYLKKKITKKGWWTGSSGRVPPTKCEALSSNQGAFKKERKKKKKKKLTNHLAVSWIYLFWIFHIKELI
jgi:hypothetical protein